MIISCRKCGTNFRFDHQLMTGEGAWFRCSRCLNVFYQDNLLWEEQTGRPAEPENKAAVPSSSETTSLSTSIIATKQDNGGTPLQTSDARLLVHIKDIRR